MKLRFFVYLISFCMLVLIFISFYFYDLAIARNEKKFLQNNPDLEVSAEAMDVFLQGDWRDWANEQNFEEWELTSYDGLLLKGYYLPARTETNKTAVFAHGYLGRGRDMTLFGEHYYENLGYNIFTADMRGHGKSEGDYIGFGWHDRLDLLDWVDYLIDRTGEDTEIILHGLSMGAATVLMMSGEELPPQVRIIIADSPYANVHELFAYQLKRIFRLPSFPLLNTTSLVTKLKAGYSFKEASALQQVQHATVPILYFHGEADTFVPTESTYRLYEATNGPKDLLTFPDASHGEGFVIARDKYIEKLHEFLIKYFY